MGLELTTDKYPPIKSQTRYPLRHAAALHVVFYHDIDPNVGQYFRFD